MSIITQLHWKSTDKICLQDIEVLTNILMDTDIEVEGRIVNLRKAGWRYEWSNKKRAFGNVRVRRGVKFVMMSKPLCALNITNPTQCEGTIRHEIAHAIQWELSNYMSHDAQWKRIAIMLGDDGGRCYDHTQVKAVTGKYRGECPECGTVYQFHRAKKRSSACITCCNTHNYGRYTERFKLAIYQN